MDFFRFINGVLRLAITCTSLVYHYQPGYGPDSASTTDLDTPVLGCPSERDAVEKHDRNGFGLLCARAISHFCAHASKHSPRTLIHTTDHVSLCLPRTSLRLLFPSFPFSFSLSRFFFPFRCPALLLRRLFSTTGKIMGCITNTVLLGAGACAGWDGGEMSGVGVPRPAWKFCWYAYPEGAYIFCVKEGGGGDTAVWCEDTGT